MAQVTRTAWGMRLEKEALSLMAVLITPKRLVVKQIISLRGLPFPLPVWRNRSRHFVPGETLRLRGLRGVRGGLPGEAISMGPAVAKAVAVREDSRVFLYG